MKQKLLKTWLMLCLLVVGVGTSWATDFKAQFGTNNHNLITSSYTDATTNVVISTNETNTSASTYTGIGSNKTVSVVIPADVTVTQILFEATGTSYPATGFTCNDKSTLADGNNGETTWTGSASNKTLVFTNGGTKTARLKSMTITYTKNGGGGNSGGGDDSGDDEDGTITINVSKLTNPFSSSSITYGTYNWTSGDVSGVYNGASSSTMTYFQFNYSSSGTSNYRDKQALYNTVAVPGKITSIKMVTASGTNRTWTPYVSSSAITPANYTSATALTAKSVTSGEGTTWDVTGNNTYFYLNYTVGSPSYIGDIIITYETAPAEPVQISNLLNKTADNVKVKDVIDLSEYVNKPNDYTGDITYSVTSGADKCGIADDVLEITKAGEITVKVSAAADDNYLLTEGTITFTATKNELGEFLNQASISLVKDETKAMSELLTLGKYDGTLSYESNNSSIAEVDEGVLYAYAIGSANITITASTTDAWVGGTKTLAVTVSGKAPTILTENKTYTLIKDGTAAATTTTADDGLTVKFRSANAEVATVDATGVITAVAAGNTTIYAYTEADAEFAAGEEVYATVTVVEPVITFTPEAGSFAADNTPVKVNVTGVEDYIYVTNPSIEDNFDMDTDGVEAGDADTEILISATTTIRVKAIDNEFNLSPMVSATFTRKQQPNIQIAGIENGSTKNITWGDEFEMPEVTAVDGATLNYRSSAYSVAAFEGSTLNILKAGTTTITVSVAEDENFVGEEYSFTLVIAKATPTVTFTTAGNQEIFIDDTEAKAYEYTCDTEGLTVSYSSSNTNVVTVDAETGALTPVKVGSAIIYAKTPSGQDNYYQGSAQYNITVKKHDATLAWNDGEGTNVNYEIGETDFAGWTATTNSDNAVTYKSSATSVATVDANTGAVNVVGKGTTTITASVAASDTYNAPTSITYTITASNGIMTFVKVDDTNMLQEGIKYIIVSDAASNNYALSSKNGTQKVNTASVTVSDNKIVLDDVNATSKPYEVSLESVSEGVWYIKTSYGYIGYDASTNWQFAATIPNTGQNAYQWTISIDGEGTTMIVNKKTTTRAFYFSGSDLKPYSTSTATGPTPLLFAKAAGTINVSKYKNTTLSLKVPYVMPEGLVGKTVSAKDGSDGNYTLTLTAKYNEGDVVPAGEALVLQGAQGTYTALAGTSTAAKTAYPENLLVAEYTKDGTGFRTSFDSENRDYYYYYKLTTSGCANFGWYYGAADGAPFSMSSKERAYLVIAKDVAGNVKGFTLDSMTEGEATAIDMVDASKNENTRIYDLQGRRVQKANRGLYIVNGKKVMFK